MPGITFAQGDYVCFIDSDDIFTDAALEAFEEAIGGRDCDLACGQLTVQRSAEQMVPKRQEKSRYIADAAAHRRDILSMSHFTRFAYSRRFLHDCGIRFDEDLKIGEDRLFLAKAQLWCRNLSISDRTVYVYRLQNSQTMEGEWTRAKQNSQLEFLLRLRNLIEAERGGKELFSFFVSKTMPWQISRLRVAAEVEPRERVIELLTAFRRRYIDGVDETVLRAESWFERLAPIPEALLEGNLGLVADELAREASALPDSTPAGFHAERRFKRLAPLANALFEGDLSLVADGYAYETGAFEE